MGIKDLWQLLKPVMVSKNLSTFRGQTAAIDASSFLYRSLYCCAASIAKKEPTTKHLFYLQRYINLFRRCRVEMIFVFDGQAFPLKQQVNETRKERRNQFLQEALKYELEGREGSHSLAESNFRKAIAVSSAITREFKFLLMANGIEFVTAPFEADAQLASMCKSRVVDFIITEDSDLVTFGCQHIFTKINGAGEGFEFKAEKLRQTLKSKARTDKNVQNVQKIAKLNHDQFVDVCILSGCDYLAHITGMGFMTSLKLIEQNQNAEGAIDHLAKKKSHKIKQVII